MGMGNDANKLSQKLGPIKNGTRTVKTSAASSPTNDKSRESLGTTKKLQKSPN
jgi:hypothetical protein